MFVKYYFIRIETININNDTVPKKIIATRSAKNSIPPGLIFSGSRFLPTPSTALIASLIKILFDLSPSQPTSFQILIIELLLVLQQTSPMDQNPFGSNNLLLSRLLLLLELHHVLRISSYSPVGVSANILTKNVNANVKTSKFSFNFSKFNILQIGEFRNYVVLNLVEHGLLLLHHTEQRIVEPTYIELVT